MEILSLQNGIKQYINRKSAQLFDYGRVSLENVDNLMVGNELYKIKSTLENYARANKINLEFSTNSELKEAQKLVVKATYKELARSYEKTAQLEPNIAATALHKSNDSMTTEDTFIRRIYRAVQALNKQVHKEQQEEFIGLCQVHLNSKGYMNIL